jgi:hypothetical protein
MLVVLLGDLDAMPLPQLHHDVEEIHAIELKLLTKRLLIDQRGKVFVRGDVGKDIENLFSQFGRGHA